MSSDDFASREAVRMWRVWRTVHEMCAERGYELTEEEVSISLEDFRAKYTDPVTGLPDRAKMNFSARPSPSMIEKYTPLATEKDPEPMPEIGNIWIEFDPADVNKNRYKGFVHHVRESGFRTGMLVTVAPIPANTKRAAAPAEPTIIEHFQEQDLLVNITKHELVPKHVLLSPNEKKALLERYRVKETQLPRIQVGDPVAKYLGLRRGQVVKIIRRSETAGRYASYRWAI